MLQAPLDCFVALAENYVKDASARPLGRPLTWFEDSATKRKEELPTFT